MNGLMRVSRSGFLRTCGAVLLGRGLDPLAIFSMPNAVAAGEATASRFSPHLGTTAYAMAEGRHVAMRIAAVSEVRRSGPFEQFSILFEAAGGVPLPQGTYRMTHAAFGVLDTFIVPVGHPTGERTVYEACFSHRAGTGAEVGVV